MRCGDVGRSRTVYVTRTGELAHLRRDCGHLRHGGATAIRAGLLDPTLKVCPRCGEDYDGRTGGGAAEMLEAADPEDLGLLPFGAR